MQIPKNVIHELAVDINALKVELVQRSFYGGSICKKLFNIPVVFDLENATICLPYAGDSINNLVTVEDIEKLIHTNNDYSRENSERAYERQERFYTSGEAFERES